MDRKLARRNLRTGLISSTVMLLIFGLTFLAAAILNAVGVTLALVGITLSLAITIVGLLLFLVTLVQWVRAAAREMSELPLDHSSH